MFTSRRTRELENLVTLLKSENSDLRAVLREERDERSRLLDRIMALTSPGALREVSRPPREPVAVPPVSQPPTMRRLHFPGYEPDTRPPSPTTPPQASLSDLQVAAARAVAEEAMNG